jgi:hypothetical protein
MNENKEAWNKDPIGIQKLCCSICTSLGQQWLLYILAKVSTEILNILQTPLLCL